MAVDIAGESADVALFGLAKQHVPFSTESFPCTPRVPGSKASPFGSRALCFLHDFEALRGRPLHSEYIASAALGTDVRVRRFVDNVVEQPPTLA